MTRAAEEAYRDARRRAGATSTVRLRLVERRLRARVDWLSRPELAALSGVRDELRARGISVPELGARP